MAADTKKKILNTAEQLFATNGIANTSLRTITQKARVNLASVNYHFGSKDELVVQVFLRRLDPMNKERLSRLVELKRRAAGSRPSLNDVIRAFVEPPLEMSRRDDGGAVFIKLLGRTYTEPTATIHGLIRATHKTVIDSYRPVFQECLPELPPEVLYWRLHFMVGVLAYTMAGSDTMRLISSGSIDDLPDPRELARQLSDFIAAGLQAPI
ncbi:MAG: TetR family transcriptional regulator [Gammaproteobacteria bacterium]|nr:TetR family transcriptional regulator [Gammaproteobacteria bacterium]